MSETVTDRLRFVLDGETIELAGIDPTRTVLEFLREDLRRTGTKEGCAEGDCGACTVVVAEAGEDGRLAPRAVNACIQFLPVLDGRELLTVESLRGADGALHPVQQAMVDNHGSQCGFCTPGFVMSLFALYKTQGDPDRVAIDDALAGNLCRCTGYRPIVAAARDMYRRVPKDAADWRLLPAGAAPGADETRRVDRLRAIDHDAMLALEQDNRRFFAPRSAESLARLLDTFPDATLLAGGTDVGLWVTKEHRELETVIYTGRVPELTAVGEEDGALVVGAAVTFGRLLDTLNARYPAFEELWLRFASPPIRNAATLGGNVANGSPIGDSMPALLALDAGLTLRGKAGTRQLPLADFYRGYRETALAPGEFVESLTLPPATREDWLAAYKVSKRFDQDISAVCAAFRLRFDGERVAEARVAFGGMAAVPARARHCEAALECRAFTPDTVADAMGALDDDFSPITDMRASDEYRLRVAKNLVERCRREREAARAGKRIERVYGHGRRRLA